MFFFISLSLSLFLLLYLLFDFFSCFFILPLVFSSLLFSSLVLSSCRVLCLSCLVWSLCRLGGRVGSFLLVLGVFWGHFWPSWGSFRALGVVLGHSGGDPCPSRAVSTVFGSILGAEREPRRSPRRDLEASRRPKGAPRRHTRRPEIDHKIVF